MVDISVAVASVSASAGSDIRKGTAGEAITQGQALYVNTTDGELYLADANAEATAKVAGISLNAAQDGQPVRYLVSGDLQLVALSGVSAGHTYVLSETAGGIAPDVDIGAGPYKTVIGVGINGTTIRVKLNVSDVVTVA